MTDLVYAAFHFFHPKLGNGSRRLVMFDQGRKWVRLCEPPTAIVVRVKRAEILGRYLIVDDPNWRRLRVTLGRRIRRNKQWDKFVSPRAKALEKLLGQAALEQSRKPASRPSSPASTVQP